MMRWAADSCLTTRQGCAITAKLALTRREPFLFLESLTQRLRDAQALSLLVADFEGELRQPGRPGPSQGTADAQRQASYGPKRRTRTGRSADTIHECWPSWLLCSMG